MNQMNLAMPGITGEDLMNDLLSTEKQMVSSYSTFICEASCPNLCQVFNGSLNESIENQCQVFLQIERRGWYPS